VADSAQYRSFPKNLWVQHEAQRRDQEVLNRDSDGEIKEAVMCISNSVGRGGANNAADVKTIQVLLNLNSASFDAPSPLAVDGITGAETVSIIDGFQTRAMGLSHPDGRIDPGSAMLKALAAGISGEKLHGIMVNAEAGNINRFVDSLISKMEARGIDTPRRQAHFLAQIGHESGKLRYVEELASGDAYEGRRDHGNIQPGDGRRFKDGVDPIDWTRELQGLW
jgi:putative chitinase